MRVERAIDAYLDWRRLERDATPRSTDSYRRILFKLAEDYPEIELQRLTTADLRTFLNRWRDASASTRANVISVLHSFFDWANVEDLVEVDPSAKIRRPRKRRPDVYRPSLDELRRLRQAARGYERPAIVLMEGAGLRRSEVLGCRWADFDMVRGRLRVFRKGQNWFYLPLAPDVVEELRVSMRELQPELDDYVFTVEVEQWASQYERVRRRKDPKEPASEQALWRMVRRVCTRAGVRLLSPHQLRHGFANRFLRESARDVAVLRRLLGHSRIDTTQLYTDEIELDEMAQALEEALLARNAQASPDLATLVQRGLNVPLSRLMEAAGIEPAQDFNRSGCGRNGHRVEALEKPLDEVNHDDVVVVEGRAGGSRTLAVRDVVAKPHEGVQGPASLVDLEPFVEFLGPGFVEPTDEGDDLSGSGIPRPLEPGERESLSRPSRHLKTNRLPGGHERLLEKTGEPEVCKAVSVGADFVFRFEVLAPVNQLVEVAPETSDFSLRCR